MKHRCILIDEVKKESKKNNIIIYILIVNLFSVIILDKINISVYIKRFLVNENGVFDNSIFWAAVGSIGSVLGLIGVVITIITTEISREKQNKIEYETQLSLEEQYEFKKEVKKQLEILDPINAINIMNIFKNETNYKEIIAKLNEYITKIKEIDYKIYWYYNRTLLGNYIELNNFSNELNRFIDDFSNIIISYNEELSKYSNIESKHIYSSLISNLNEEEKLKLNMLNNEIKDEFLYKENIYKNLNNITSKLIEYRNKNWNIIIEKAKLMIEERDNLLKQKLNIK